MTDLPNWNIQETWNELTLNEEPPKPRDYIRASELGSPFLDRYLKMKGVPFTNPYTPRVRRIFDCGNIFEEVVERVFRLCGILVTVQEEVKLQHDDMLPVVGHFDLKVGGTVQIEKVRRILNKDNFTNLFATIRTQDPDLADFIEFMYPAEWLRNRSLKMAETLARKYPNGMKQLITEVKSVNSRAFWGHKNQDPETGFFKGYDNHKLQLYTYLMGTNSDEGRRFYVSKDDLTLMESPVYLSNLMLADLWKQDVSEMTKYIKLNREPDKLPDIIYDEDKKMYDFNWQISRSPYFTYITGKKTLEDWEYSLRGELRKLNTKPCSDCGKDYQLATLNKNAGLCGRCVKKRKGVTNNE